MADGVQIYGLDESKNRIATMSTEQILAAIQRAIATGEVTDEFKAFIEMIKEQNKGIGVKFWLGTQDEFNALEKTESNTIYFVYTTVIKDISDGIQKLYDGLQDGTIVVKTATDANNVTLKINGKNISDIFESDGVTAKKATSDKNGIPFHEGYLQQKDRVKKVTFDVDNVTFAGAVEIADIPEGKSFEDLFAVAIRYIDDDDADFSSIVRYAGKIAILYMSNVRTGAQGDDWLNVQHTTNITLSSSSGKISMKLDRYCRVIHNLQTNEIKVTHKKSTIGDNIMTVQGSLYFK